MKKVLIADDSSVMRLILQNTLIENGLTKANMFEAADGEVALQQTKDNKIDIFLVDWNMPKLNGLDFVKTLRDIEEYKDAPVIMVTSEAAKYNVMEAIEAGVTNYIVKPIHGSTLWEHISKYFH